MKLGESDSRKGAPRVGHDTDLVVEEAVLGHFKVSSTPPKCPYLQRLQHSKWHSVQCKCMVGDVEEKGHKTER